MAVKPTPVQKNDHRPACHSPIEIMEFQAIEQDLTINGQDYFVHLQASALDDRAQMIAIFTCIDTHFDTPS